LTPQSASITPTGSKRCRYGWITARRGGDRLTDEHIADAAKKGNDLYRAVEILLKGPEVSLTDNKVGKRRTKARISQADDRVDQPFGRDRPAGW
jgi:hypothetical protein